jgi:ATP-dependent DNA ligase
VSDRHCSLISRKNHAYKSFAPLRESFAQLKAKNAILDSEIVCLDQDGRSQFNPLLRRRGQASFYALDLVWMNGEDLRLLPLVERKGRLRKLIFRSQIPGVICAGYVEDYGKACSRKSANEIWKELLRSRRTVDTL